MEIGIGVFTGEVMPEEGKEQPEILEDSLQQMKLAEDVGLDAIWISEHHFLSNGYIGSVLPFAAAAAARTSKITIGVSVALAPLHDPIRLAEDAVFVDQLSGGRHQLGLALGYRDVEYLGFGTTRRHRVQRIEELVTLLRQAWGDGPVDHDGRHFPRHGFEVFPKPRQPGGIPILMGGHALPAIDRVARMADAFIMDGGTDSDVFAEEGHNRDLFDRVASALRLYKEALERHGRPSEDPPFYMTLGGFLHEDGADAAWEQVQDAYMYTRRVYGDWYGVDPAEYERWRPELMPPEEHARRRTEIWLGSPKDLIPRFERLRDLVGDRLHVMFRPKYPGVPDDRTRRCIELLGEVRDHFR